MAGVSRKQVSRMDPLTAAGAFATIVGLLGNFKAERSSSDLSDFYEWLKEKHHEEVAASIQRNETLSQQLSQILSSNHDELIDGLNQLDILISSVAGQIKEFSGLAKTIHAESIFSDQAIHILKQFVASGAKMIMEHKIRSRSNSDKYFLMEGAHGEIEYDEPRFMEDDLQTLVGTGLITLQYTSKGTRQFLITRSAVSFVNAIER